ncbi:hypothetical protein WBK31_11585 [Nonomuraea sp. N2-4H]
MLVISGQVLSAVVIDCIQQGALPAPIRLAGVVLVLLGLTLPGLSARLRQREIHPCPTEKK